MIWPNWGQVRPPHLVNLDQIGRCGSGLGQHSARIWPVPAQLWPNPANIRPNSADLAANWANFGPKVRQARPNFGRNGPTLANFGRTWPSLGRFRRHTQPKFGQVLSNLARSRAPSVQLSPTSARVGQYLSESAQFRPGSAKCYRCSAELGQHLISFGPDVASAGPKWLTYVEVGPVLGEFGLKWATAVRVLQKTWVPTLGGSRPDVADLGQSLAHVDQNWTGFRAYFGCGHGSAERADHAGAPRFDRTSFSCFVGQHRSDGFALGTFEFQAAGVPALLQMCSGTAIIRLVRVVRVLRVFSAMSFLSKIDRVMVQAGAAVSRGRAAMSWAVIRQLPFL